MMKRVLHPVEPGPHLAPVTKRQREFLRAILCFNLQHGYPPTIRELAELVGVASAGGVLRHLDVLTKKALLTRETATSRSLRLTQRGINEACPNANVARMGGGQS